VSRTRRGRVVNECPACQTSNPEDSKFCRECGTNLTFSEEISVSQTKTLQTPAQNLFTGKTFADRYQLIEELGRGGMGVVYRAHDTKLKRTVALKFLPLELTHIPQVIERFMREAQAAAALDHPHICTVYEFDEAEEKAYISMAFVKGQSLKKKIESGPTELDEAVRLATQIAEGLREAHKKGVVHRDIKSANIMVDEKGQAKIMDFGLARVAGGTLVTKEGMTMGTIAYMSPEQARGEAVDHRTDIWSFGVVLYEMFSGQLPFLGEHDQSVIFSILNEQPKSVSELNTEIPAALAQIIGKALEKDRDQRYQQIDELLDDLKSIAAGIIPEEIKVRLRKAKLRRRKRVILYSGAAGLLIMMIVIALSLFTGRAEAIDAIAVLPLENLTGDSEQEYFVDAATDELIGQLSQIKALNVISRYSVLQYKGLGKPLPEISRELNVDALVVGSVLQVGDSVRIRVQLIEAIPEEQNLWAQTYNRDMADVQVMYKEMARAIVGETRVKLTPEEETFLASTRQVNPEAYEAYTKGMFHFYKLTPQDLELALGYFELAAEKDPNYALAHLGISQVWGGRMQQGLVSTSEAGPKAEAARQKARELDDTLKEFLYAEATSKTWREWDWEGAERAFKRVIELHPNYPDPRAYYSQFLFMMRRPDEAMAQIERALQIDPFSSAFRSIYGFDLMYAHRFDEAVEYLQEALRTAPTDPFVLSAIKSAYHLTGQHEEALEIWKKSSASEGDQEAVEVLTSGYAEASYVGALSRLAELLIERSHTTFVTPWRIATLYTRAGKDEEALEWLEKGYEAHDPNMPYICIDPIFDSIYDHPRFQNILLQMNLPLEKFSPSPR